MASIQSYKADIIQKFHKKYFLKFRKNLEFMFSVELKNPRNPEHAVALLEISELVDYVIEKVITQNIFQTTIYLQIRIITI